MKNFFLLSMCKVGKTYTIKSMCDGIDIKTRTRLYELGFFEGEKITVLAKSLLGGVILIEVLSCAITLRTSEAACVVVQ